MTYEQQVLDYALDVAYNLGANVGDRYVGNVAAIQRVVESYISDLGDVLATALDGQEDYEDFWMNVVDSYEQGVQETWA